MDTAIEFPIPVVDPRDGNPLHLSEEGFVAKDGVVFPLVGGAYRMLLPQERQANYSDSFGLQWNTFVGTQLDENGVDLSQKRFFAQTNWQNLDGETILEVGSGAGRFTRVILRHTKAELYSVDYSAAVEANY
ncbi:MAG: class I SAM-dependent methyltransferase, partial [Bacteroidia bacterium]|nr:class I SAM-dependent methyltransferase [Bacteroidia bacterium]